jgi:hypothetical protein
MQSALIVGDDLFGRQVVFVIVHYFLKVWGVTNE